MAPSCTEAQCLAAVAAAFIINTVMFAAQIYAGSFYDKTPYHTSALTSEMWVEELVNGHTFAKMGSGVLLIWLSSLLDSWGAILRSWGGGEGDWTRMSTYKKNEIWICTQWEIGVPGSGSSSWLSILGSWDPWEAQYAFAPCRVVSMRGWTFLNHIQPLLQNGEAPLCFCQEHMSWCDIRADISASDQWAWAFAMEST